MQKENEKAERFKWEKIGEWGEFRMIPISDLKIDHSYQRQEISERNSLAIAAKLNCSAFGVLVVVERSNGDLYVIDGQQRLAATKRRGDIETVPCIVFKSDGREREAISFVNININRKAVTALDKYRALVKADIEPAKSINAWLNSRGLRVSADGKAINNIDFPSILMEFWTQDVDSSKKAISIQQTIIGPSPMHSYLHKGIWWLEHNKVDVSRHIEKLQRAGGLSAILRAINTIAIETGLEGRNMRICGLGLLNIINYRRRLKIRIPEN